MHSVLESSERSNFSFCSLIRNFFYLQCLQGEQIVRMLTCRVLLTKIPSLVLPSLDINAGAIIFISFDTCVRRSYPRLPRRQNDSIENFLESCCSSYHCICHQQLLERERFFFKGKKAKAQFCIPQKISSHAVWSVSCSWELTAPKSDSCKVTNRANYDQNISAFSFNLVC